MTKGQKIELLLDRCQRRETLPELLAALERDRPTQYRRRFGAPIAQVRPEPLTVSARRRQVFISHAHEDAEFAHQLADDLRQSGWRVWDRARTTSGPGKSGWRRSSAGWTKAASSSFC